MQDKKQTLPRHQVHQRNQKADGEHHQAEGQALGDLLEGAGGLIPEGGEEVGVFARRGVAVHQAVL